jgi:PucR C-terminal helix-turn-helix domain
MASRAPRRTAGHGVLLSPEVIADMRAHLPDVAEQTVEAIIEEVPSYQDALSGSMGEIIRNAVQLALGGFLSLAGGRRGADPGTPTAPAMEGAYQLGRGEARNGRTTDALLSAYRIGARVSWREMSTRAVAAGIPADRLAGFAELVFAYIDELSAASVAGHTDELATSGRVRERLLERLAADLLDGATSEEVNQAAARAEWTPPSTLTAVIVPEAMARAVRTALSGVVLQAVDRSDLPDDTALLLVPDAHGRRRTKLLGSLTARGCIAGPPRPWLQVRASYDRAMRARAAGLWGDTEDHLTRLVLTADPEALEDLRAKALAPLAELRPAVAEKLADTLRSWLLHHGRREDVAAELFVHPQTVRYRMGQLRELYGKRLEDPRTVLELTIALGVSES